MTIPELGEGKSITGQKFPGFGRCIFCGSDGGAAGLRREHMVPYSLGGNAEILDATCALCEGKTSYIDGYLANSVYREFRIHARLPSRSRTTTKTTTLPATYRLAETGAETTVELPIADHPHWVHLPNLAPPGILDRRPEDSSFLHQGAFSLYFVPPTFREATGLPADSQHQIRGDTDISLHPFARAIAKIAYCHGVAMYGLDGFHSMDLPALILGTYPYPSHYVGGYGGDLPPPREPFRLHAIGCGPVRVGDKILLETTVRLFASYGTAEGGPGMPIFRVVVGELIA